MGDAIRRNCPLSVQSSERMNGEGKEKNKGEKRKVKGTTRWTNQPEKEIYFRADDVYIYGSNLRNKKALSYQYIIL